MSDRNKLLVRIGATILLVVVVYFLFSYIAAAVLSHQAYVFELKDIVVPLVLGLVAEYMDIKKFITWNKDE